MKEIYEFFNIDFKPFIFIGVFLVLVLVLIFVIKAIKDYKNNKMIKEINDKLDEINKKLDNLGK